jgi:hypothetical protein
MKKYFILFIAMIFLSFDSFTQNTVSLDFAAKDIILRLTLTENTKENYKLSIDTVISNGFAIEKSSININNLNPDIFKASVNKLISECTSNIYNLELQIYVKSLNIFLINEFKKYSIDIPKDTLNIISACFELYLTTPTIDDQKINECLLSLSNYKNLDSLDVISVKMKDKISDVKKMFLISGVNEIRSKFSDIVLKSYSDLINKLDVKRTEFDFYENYGLTEIDILNRENLLLEYYKKRDSIISLRIMKNNALKKSVLKSFINSVRDTSDILPFNKLFSLSKLNHNIRKKNITEPNKLSEKLKKKIEEIFKDSQTFSNSLFTLKSSRIKLKEEIKSIDRKREDVINLIGEANFVSSFRNSTSTQANAGFGLLASKPGVEEFYGVITVAESIDSISFNYGQTLLIPGISKFSLMTKWRNFSLFPYHSRRFFRSIGLGLDVNVSPYKWVNDTINTKVVPCALNVLLPYTFVQINNSRENISISTDMGMTLRYIGGDIKDSEMITLLNNNSKKFHFGFIAGIDIKYNALRAQFHVPIFKEKEKPIEGFSNGQVFASIGILSNLSSDISKVFKTGRD